MKEVLQFLAENPVQYLATVGRDGKAKCRPFMFCFERGGRLWFCTNSQKEVYADMQSNPCIELCVANAQCAWLRLSGKAVFENDRAVKAACMDIPIVKQQYASADNPIFEVFYLAEGKAVIADFSGEPPRAYAL